MTTASRSNRSVAAAAVLVVIAIALLVGSEACRSSETRDAASRPDSAAYRAAWQDWRDKRAKLVLTPGRPLSYTALTWIHAGANTVGSSLTNDVKLAGKRVPAHLGHLIRLGDTVRFEPAPRVPVTVDSVPVTSGVILRTDADTLPSRVLAGSAGFRIVKRVDSIGVRAWDSERAALKAFPGITLFALDARWRYPAQFHPLAAPRRVAVMTESGVPEEHDVLGTIDATIEGKPYTFTAFSGTRTNLFITFADESSGEATYGFRFLQIPRDTTNTNIVLDFNYAYNPDCAFSPYTTCPLPPPENRIHAPILAGERRLAYERGKR